MSSMPGAFFFAPSRCSHSLDDDGMRSAVRFLISRERRARLRQSPAFLTRAF